MIPWYALIIGLIGVYVGLCVGCLLAAASKKMPRE